jgi:hypothetical protein
MTIGENSAPSLLDTDGVAPVDPFFFKVSL